MEVDFLFVVAITDVHAAKCVCDVLTVSVNVEQSSIVKHMSLFCTLSFNLYA